jgi:hypothetical protein
VPVTSGDDEDSTYMIAMRKTDPTINHLASLLATGSDKLLASKVGFWLVLDFYCPGPRVVLPVEIGKGKYPHS